MSPGLSYSTDEIEKEVVCSVIAIGYLVSGRNKKYGRLLVTKFYPDLPYGIIIIRKTGHKDETKISIDCMQSLYICMNHHHCNTQDWIVNY